MFQTGDVLYGEGKLRDLGMVFKPSFKCLKNKKINLSPAFLKLETLLFQNMFLLFHLILYSQSDFDSKKKKKWSKRKKNMPISKVNNVPTSCKVPKDNAKLRFKCKYCLRDFAGLQLHLKRNPICRLKNEEWSTNLGK